MPLLWEYKYNSVIPILFEGDVFILFTTHIFHHCMIDVLC